MARREGQRPRRSGAHRTPAPAGWRRTRDAEVGREEIRGEAAGSGKSRCEEDRSQQGRPEKGLGEEGFKLVWYRTGPKALQSNLLPYVVEVVAADKAGILFQLADFFDRQGITIESLHSSRYRAMQTGAEMFTAQVTVGIPANMHIAALRDDFMEFCDHLNLDAIMDPMKF
jgi:predicted amino acid-binding ACT domain protein